MTVFLSRNIKYMNPTQVNGTNVPDVGLCYNHKRITQIGWMAIASWLSLSVI
jgi:hypothetical protein